MICAECKIQDKKANFNTMLFIISIHIFATFFWAASARDFDVFERKFVIVSQLLANFDSPERKNDDVLFTQNVDNLGVAVRLKGQN